MALNRELGTVIREAKERADRIMEASDLWEMEVWLAEQRERIDRTFDFRYSVGNPVEGERDSALKPNTIPL